MSKITNYTEKKVFDIYDYNYMIGNSIFIVIIAIYNVNHNNYIYLYKKNI